MNKNNKYVIIRIIATVLFFIVWIGMSLGLFLVANECFEIGEYYNGIVLCVVSFTIIFMVMPIVLSL